MVRIFIKKWCGYSSKNVDGPEAPLMQAVAFGHLDIVKYLVSKADIGLMRFSFYIS